MAYAALAKLHIVDSSYSVRDSLEKIPDVITKQIKSFYDIISLENQPGVEL